MYPLYQLLKKSEKTFVLSEEGKLAIQEIKKFLIQETMTYNIDHKLPLYLNTDKTMTEKIAMLKNKVVHVRPISWYSKTFTQGQVINYVAMEKEFLALLLTVMNFRDYIESVPVTYVLSDSQPVLWVLKHSGESLKLARHLMKLFELNINIVCVHVAGHKNSVADFLSRIFGRGL